MKRVTLTLGLLVVLAATLYAQTFTPYDVKVVAEQDFISQASNIPTTTIKTPTNAGNYQVVVYGVTPSSTINASVQLILTWTDEFDTRTLQLTIGPGGTGVNYATIANVMHVAAGTPIQVSGTYNPGTSGGAYDIYVTLVKE